MEEEGEWEEDKGRKSIGVGDEDKSGHTSVHSLFADNHESYLATFRH